MIRVLFVDDEADVLEGLRVSLRKYRRRINMAFAEGPKPALEHLEGNTVDVLISDMRMPEMDGAELLARVKDDHPETMRVILSGQTDSGQMLRSLTVAHRVLSKPAKREILDEIFKSVEAAHEIISDPQIRAAIGAIEWLPPAPKTREVVQAELQRSDPSVAVLANAVKQDPGLAVRVLQFANSSFFAVGRPVTDAQDAAEALGAPTVARLLNEDGALPENYPDELADLLRDSNSPLATDPTQSGGDRLAEEVGLLVAATNLSQQFRAAIAQTRDRAIGLNEAELQAFGATHESVGAYLLELWGVQQSAE